jgi:hypothetical protein
VPLPDGAVLPPSIGPVRKRIAADDVRMLACQFAEHNESGMSFNFNVLAAAESAEVIR